MKRNAHPQYSDAKEEEVLRERVLLSMRETSAVVISSDEEEGQVSAGGLQKRRRGGSHRSDSSHDEEERLPRKRLRAAHDGVLRKSKAQQQGRGRSKILHSPTKVPQVGAYATPESSQETVAHSVLTAPYKPQWCEPEPTLRSESSQREYEYESPSILETYDSQSLLAADARQAIGFQAGQSSSQQSTSWHFLQPSPAVLATPTSSQEVSDPKAPGIPIKERKLYVLYKLPSVYKTKLLHLVQPYIDELPQERSEDECWLYTGSRFPKNCRTLHIHFSFWVDGKRAAWSMNVGTAVMLLKGQLNPVDKYILMEEEGSLSHRCGNWTCLNTRHHCIETLSNNQSRNKCFRLPACEHEPPCLKDLKVEPVHRLRPPSPETIRMRDSMKKYLQAKRTVPSSNELSHRFAQDEPTS
ncbi:hypothetical protein BU16DRAFT_545130 [Lophium mytilinum]|uniref:Zinc-binding loop region of homing endonuclease domain-containing protein n=1 Tax=Lophium mytilinum TaxID=390894 RepID=A0A6A6QA60_9PEZI|nr:hypothetical protein BU16DRAFT_545130 [Lophium mytilinum]